MVASLSACSNGDAPVPLRECGFGDIQSNSDEDEELLLNSVGDCSSDLELNADECDSCNGEDLLATQKWTKLDNGKLHLFHFPFW